MNASALVALALVLTVPGRAFSQAPPAPAQPADREYRIQIGDQLDIKFFYNPELNEQVMVRPDGRISLQLVPEIVAAGMTPAALTQHLIKLYSADLKQPRVTVIVRGFGSQRVFVDGEVGKPGLIPIVGTMSVLEAVAEAGGTKDTARTTEVVVIRRGPADKPVVFRVNLKSARDGSDLAQDVALLPFDIVFVPRSRIANVNLFVDQYIRKNIPVTFGLNYGIYR